MGELVATVQEAGTHRGVSDATIEVLTTQNDIVATMTPDATGLGHWTAEDFIKTLRSGKHLGSGRALLPPMPWFNTASLSDEELKDLFAYLKSLKPILNKVPEPIPPG